MKMMVKGQFLNTLTARRRRVMGQNVDTCKMKNERVFKELN